ncbi:uncharacterized protein LOC118184021 [Stegodyphus dumicola]|uniref:uncharacterized protein LOC118184021 n=1 Tax=Stegodyphus dumicola TaxID=202533 RepID=UPI0015A893C9|nr:uncharacterized protein LOC118184021 [Stegodyphus dumicola]
MWAVIMLSRLNTSSEVSILPTGLGNHYTSSSRHLIPPGRRRYPYNHSISSNSDCHVGDPNAPEANMSFREHQEYFGPDVLVIIGLVLACFGAILTLISFYCQFKHPAIQATMAGIGPSLVGIGMLFCVLRLFFCTFCISRTCCECIADGLRFLVIRCPCTKCFKKSKKKIHPLQVKETNALKAVANGQVSIKSFNNSTQTKIDYGMNNYYSNNNDKSHNVVPARAQEATKTSSIEMTSLPTRMDPIKEAEEQQRTPSVHAEEKDDSITEVRVDSTNLEEPQKVEDDIIKDEIELLEEMKSEGSPESNKSLNKNINDLVLKTTPKY